MPGVHRQRNNRLLVTIEPEQVEGFRLGIDDPGAIVVEIVLIASLQQPEEVVHIAPVEKLAVSFIAGRAITDAQGLAEHVLTEPAESIAEVRLELALGVPHDAVRRGGDLPR